MADSWEFSMALVRKKVKV